MLAASDTTELAARFGRRVRNLIIEHGAMLGLELSEDSTAAGRWALTENTGGSEYYAAGVDTGIAGFRADLALIDDPVRSRSDAESSTLRDRQWDWYKSDLLPRLRPGAAIVLIMTRWHEDDLAGRLLAEAGRRTGEKTMVRASAPSAQKPVDYGPSERLTEERIVISSPVAVASGPSAATPADAGAPSADHPYSSKNEIRKSEMGPVSNSISRVRGGGGHEFMSDVRGESRPGGAGTSVRSAGGGGEVAGGKPVYRVELPRVDSPPLVTKPPVTKGVVTKPDSSGSLRPLIARTPFGGRRPPYSAEKGVAWG